MDASRAFPAVLTGLLLVSSLAGQAPATGEVGWYNGEWQSGIPGVPNWYDGSHTFSRAYDEFEVPAGGWQVIGVFSDNTLGEFSRVTRASWQIRRDMAEGFGGKVVASGVGRATVMPDPSVTTPRYPADEVASHHRIQVDGLHVSLPAGRYWLSVTPVGRGQSFLSATVGAHAVGGGALGPALVDTGDPASFVPAPMVAPRGQAGVARRFAQGVLIAR